VRHESPFLASVAKKFELATEASSFRNDLGFNDAGVVAWTDAPVPGRPPKKINKRRITLKKGLSPKILLLMPPQEMRQIYPSFKVEQIYARENLLPFGPG